MADSKKNLYHSQAAAMGPLKVTVKTAPQKSKYAGKPDWCPLVVNGEDKNYTVENAVVAIVLNSLVGKTATLVFVGSRDTANIEVHGEATGAAPAPHQPPAAAQRQQERAVAADCAPWQQGERPEPKPVDAKKAMGQRAHLMYLAQKGAHYIAEQLAKETGASPLLLSAEDIRCIGNSLYIDAARDGLHHHLSPSFPEKKPNSK